LTDLYAFKVGAFQLAHPVHKVINTSISYMHT